MKIAKMIAGIAARRRATKSLRGPLGRVRLRAGRAPPRLRPRPPPPPPPPARAFSRWAARSRARADAGDGADGVEKRRGGREAIQRPPKRRLRASYSASDCSKA